MFYIRNIQRGSEWLKKQKVLVLITLLKVKPKKRPGRHSKKHKGKKKGGRGQGYPI
jgi:hypothetical protein